MKEEKQYIIIGKIPNIFKQPRVRLDKTKGTFIECPHCKRLLEISNLKDEE